MMSLEEYKRLNYKMVVQYNSKEQSYFVEFPELPGCMADDEDLTRALEKAQKAKDEWLTVALESGYSIPLPFEKPETTGRQTIRMPKYLHGQLIERAEQEGVSQNQLILTFIAEGLQRTQTRDLFNGVMDAYEKISKQLNENKTGFSILSTSVASWINKAIQEAPLVQHFENASSENAIWVCDDAFHVQGGYITHSLTGPQLIASKASKGKEREEKSLAVAV